MPPRRQQPASSPPATTASTAPREAIPLTATGPLPRGRHKLSREEVTRNQTIRLLEAMVRTVGDRGYAETSVGAVARGAGVSREAFYSLFRDKEDASFAPTMP
jgi:AcrR family transcriptional regulator